MKISLIVLAALVASFLTACDSTGTSHPNTTPTAQNGAIHGAPKQPSTNQ